MAFLSVALAACSSHDGGAGDAGGQFDVGGQGDTAAQVDLGSQGDVGDRVDVGGEGDAAEEELHVSYDANGATAGSVPGEAGPYREGALVVVAANSGGLVRPCYRFAGWNTQADGGGASYAVGSELTIGSGDVKLYARWVGDCSVTYSANQATGGTVPVDALTYAGGELASVAGNTGTLVRDGYTFTGWNTAPDGSGTSYTQSESFVMGSDSMTLYAKWDVLASRRWWPVAMSADGATIVAAMWHGSLFVSHDRGATWKEYSANLDWSAVATSSDGMTIAGLGQFGSVRISQDGGISWQSANTGAVGSYFALALSRDGSTLAVARNGGQIYVSTNHGASWTPHETDRYWGALAFNSDGTRIGAAETGGKVYTSEAPWATWTAHDVGVDGDWFSIAMSSNGTRLAVADNAAAGKIYVSSDGGAAWTGYVPATSTGEWQSVAISDDGAVVAAVAEGQRVYVSTDAGATWTARDSVRNWISVACSADGKRMVAAVDSWNTAADGYVFTSADSGASWTPRY